MRCRARILIVEAKKKGSGEPYEKVSASWSIHHMKYPRINIPDGTVECGGVVKALIETEYLGSCQCSGASIKIEYKCTRCGSLHYPELPSTADELSGFMTKLLDAMSADEYDAAIKDYERKQDEHEKKMAQWRKDSCHKPK